MTDVIGLQDQSILDTIKKLLGIRETGYDVFDNNIIPSINTVFVDLNRLGVGPPDGFSINGSETTWGDYTDRLDIESLKSYIYLQVRLLFDPPQSSFLVENIKEQCKRLEFGLLVQTEKF